MFTRADKNKDGKLTQEVATRNEYELDNVSRLDSGTVHLYRTQVRTLPCLVCRSNTPSPLSKLPNEDNLSKFWQVFVIVVKLIFQSSYMYISPNKTKLKFDHGFEACS